MMWQNYRDIVYHFCINYPSDYVIVERKIPLELIPRPVHTVAFLNRHLAQSPTAEFQPPVALIEVFPNIEGKSLSHWLRQYEPKATLRRLSVSGLDGFRITLPILLAPNEFIYFGSDTYIYRLTLLGEYAEQMLQSFQLQG